MEKSADVLLKDGVIRIITRATTIKAGLNIAYRPVFFLNVIDSPEMIGLKALDALNGFKEGIVPDPQNQAEWDAELSEHHRSLQLTSSWHTFVEKGAKNVDLKMENDIVTITPNKNLVAAKIKGKGDFKTLRDKSRTCSPIPEELGRAILTAFDDCE